MYNTIQYGVYQAFKATEVFLFKPECVRMLYNAKVYGKVSVLHVLMTGSLILLHVL